MSNVKSSLQMWEDTRVQDCDCKFCIGEWWTTDKLGEIHIKGPMWDKYSSPSTPGARERAVTFGTQEYLLVPAACLNLKKTSTIKFNYPNGVVCKKCNCKNEYAEPNQDDLSYICYSCR